MRATCPAHLILLDFFLLSLAPQPSLGLGLVHKIRLNFLESSQHFSFYKVGLLAPRPTPIPEDQASVFISPRGRVARLYPWASILVASYDTHGLRGDYSYSPVTTRGESYITLVNKHSILEAYSEYGTRSFLQVSGQLHTPADITPGGDPVSIEN
jgi:hypothetical protein